MPYFYHNHGKWLCLSNFCCVFWVYKYYFHLIKTSYISTFRCYTHVKPKVVTKKDIKDIKGISSHTHTHKHTHTHTHTHTLYIYIYAHIIYIHTHIYIYTYMHIHIQGST